MPEQSYPPPAGDLGAFTSPRQLARWLDKNPQNGPLKRIRKFFTMPTFEVADRWDGYSDIVCSFNYSGGKNFSIKPGYDVPAAPNYVLCISYRVGNVVTRYLLWDADGSNLNQDIPLYTGQPILANFRLEVWNTSQGISSETDTFRFNSSILGPFDYRYQQDQVLAANDTPCLDFWDFTDGLNNILLPGAVANFFAATGVWGMQLGMTPGLTYNYSTAPTGHPNARIYASDAFGSYSPIANAGDPNFIATVFPNIKFYILDFISPYTENEAITGGILSAVDYSDIFFVPLTFPANSVSVAN